MNNTKLVTIPTTLRLEVPSDMSDDAIKKLVGALTIGDFAIYPDDTNKSLISQVIEHSIVEPNIDIENAVKQVSSVDLWSAGNEYNVIEL
ncbi:hypothetical protein F0M16_20960 [Vibrio cholerae]|uniref:Uncharacterized protein n=1 Tax=Vibrio cholerae TaxID=666 RepID=A0A5Q6PD57_VIBCL|nr:hypothetical protein [Vibrio cholerae]KAA1252805.1 hypothetical protein F0M16_20960 [Vibrio cholerae]